MKKTSILLFIAGMLIMAMLVIGCQEPADSSGGGGGGGGNNNNSTTTTPTTTTPTTTIPTTTTTTTTPTYTITYDGNGNTGGSVPVDSTSYTEGQSVTVPGNSGNLTKTNCSFLCWNTKADGTGTFYIPGQTFTMGNANVVLYAILLDKSEMASIAGGTYTQTDDGTTNPGHGFSHTISSFSMGKYEVTYELWYTVYQWAITNGYVFANAGREGNDGTIGASPTGAKYEPVTTISWRDSIVWCNAYSGMSGLNPCYTYNSSVIKDSRDSNATACDNAVCTLTNNGYRLPTEGEWQYAASNKGVTPWNYGSGGTGAYTGVNVNDYPLFNPIAWYGNSTTSPYGNTTTTKNTGTKTANALSLYDMSGNVWEWCWDWDDSYPGTAQNDYIGPVSGSDRIGRGGGWIYSADGLQVGYRSSIGPDYRVYGIGFRVARR